MKLIIPTLLTLAASAAIPSLSLAQEVEIEGFGEVTIGADRTGSGLGPTSTALEGEVILTQGGFTSGVYVESIDEPTDDVEISLYTGYSIEAGAGTYGLTVTGYFWNNTGFQSYELTLGAEYALTDTTLAYGELTYNVTDDETSALIGTELSLGEALTVGLEAEHYIEAATTDLTLLAEYAINDNWSIGTELVRSESENSNYGEVGVTYGFASGASVGLLYEDADNSDGRVSLVLGYEF